MTSPELNASGDERNILLHALREYSDSCDAPDLTADCPFALATRGGGRICEEQCLDLLGRHGAPAAIADVDVGLGFSVRRRRRRPRSRFMNDTVTRPFDARAMWLEDKELQIETRRSVSLIYGLGELTTVIPPADDEEREARIAEIWRSIGILEERGFAFDTDLQPQLSVRLVGTITTLLLFAPRSEPGTDSASPASTSFFAAMLEFVNAWTPLLNDAGIKIEELSLDRESTEQRIEYMPRLIGGLATWASEADFGDVIAWKPPDSGLPAPSPRLGEQLSPKRDPWIIDRFLETYLEDWATSSLHQEWKWLHGETACPIPSDEMKVRAVDESALAKLIADRAVDETDLVDPLQMNTLQRVARDLLDSGSPDAAAAVFEAVAIEAPDRADAHNNLGFCLVHSDPERALKSLDRAAELGYQPKVVNICNRALCLVKLGRYGPAIALIEEGFELAKLTPHQGAWLWAPDPDALGEIIDAENLGLYLASLGLIAAEASDDNDKIRLWTDVLADIRTETETP